MTGEIDDLQLQVDSSNQLAISLEKKSRNFDKIVSEWKAKVEDLTQQLEEAQKEKRYNTVRNSRKVFGGFDSIFHVYLMMGFKKYARN